MSASALQGRAHKAKEWLFDACLPLWAERGIHSGGFLEALDLEHMPILDDAVRVRVQARQTFVFAAAQRLGWPSERVRDLVQLGLGVMEKSCRREDGLFGRRIDLATGLLTDDTGDLYDTAFALYALSTVAKLGRETGRTDLTARADRLIAQTFTAVETGLADPTGGFAECLPRSKYRRQNPHMHLFEASLDLAISTGEADHRKRSDALHELCLQHFIDPETGTLGEYFLHGTWQIPEGGAGSLVEPGHHFEWVWLMKEYTRLSGSALPEQARRLYDFACQTLDAEGRTILICRRDGTSVDASRRTWSQTEALKAHITMWQDGDEGAGARAVESFDVLMDEYLTPQGGWIDHFEADGRVRATTMPASTGYHVVLAFTALIDAVEA